MELSEKDRRLIRELREADVLQDIDGHRLNQEDGAILITCSDADQFFDMFRHQVKMQADQRTDPRIHVFAWNGGALALAPDSPINRITHAEDVFLQQIADARSMKKIDTVALYAHAPCGAARMAGIDLEESFVLLISAKQKIKTLNQGIQLANFFHVDYGEKVKRTYFFCRQKWEKWVQEHRLATLVV